MELLQNPSVFRRVCAFLIDHVIFTIVVVMIFFVILGQDNLDISAMPIKMIILLAAAFILYCSKDIINGRSIGKRVFGLAVRDDNNNVPKASKLFIRNLFTFLWPVELIVILVSQQKKKIGDRLVHTNVIVIRKNKGILGIILSISSIAIFFICIILFGVLQIMKQSDSYKVATDYIQSSSDIREIVGNEIKFGYFPMGSIQYENGYGKSDLTMKVKGKNKTISVHILLDKKPGSDWFIESVDY
ncbi:RDD family protein [Cohnella endophytica]|uniref:RDD family protein n=1 Tax=Cohnella endophytica TaxID=2419778 RepID=UPI001314D0AA|nr:cytochrome c oxidase assembly factor Coa1 family protein [Cohnella endophytica]